MASHNGLEFYKRQRDADRGVGSSGTLDPAGKHDHGDQNIRAAYIHVLADGLTSLTAIIALSIGWYYNLYWLDDVSGIIGTIVITSWAVQLIKGSGSKLIDFRLK